ncbi:SGNH/GDSL hydrolase family protein [Reyranella sp.]|jgi:lysophospholipase L1-like esterase|uniref:SGNH/GDSL hydrolase family protein n=1 Tax=Reyranella sp. TaxID=1929291 RepID=UPI00272871CA|nr:SGNH/GDSL hydrolase family protein [Reyranella sp.]MDO8973656.1 SGNH/GDSL hydrolase family protein [Reyranella sp.]
MTQPAKTTTATLPLWKKILFSLILLVGFPVAGILAIEGVGYAIMHFKYGVPGKTYGLWTHDAELGAIHSRNGYNSNSETNNYGFRNKEDVFEPKPPGSIRVIAYGGSTTFCYNLDTDQAWPIRLQEELRKHAGPKSQVMNAGAIVWSIGQEVARAKRDLPKLKPDVVIIYSGLNEEANAGHLQREGVSLKDAVAQGKHGLFATNLDQSRWLKRNSLIVRYIEYLNPFGQTHSSEPVPEYPIVPEVRENFNRTLREFIELIRQNGAKPLYVIMGGLHEIGQNRLLLRYSREGAAVAREMGVPVIDSNDVIRDYKGNRGDLFSPSGAHWSALGAELLAKFIDEQALKVMVKPN